MGWGDKGRFIKEDGVGEDGGAAEWSCALGHYVSLDVKHRAQIAQLHKVYFLSSPTPILLFCLQIENSIYKPPFLR